MGNKTNKKNQSGLSSYFQELNVNAPLFDELEKDPAWWRKLREDKDLYINVRKNNYINVYYRGASVMKLCYKEQRFEAEIHNNYLGVDKDVAETLAVPYGVERLPPEKIVAMLETIKYRIRKNKKNKGLPETEIDDDETASEKFIQSEEYKKGYYLDTEFAVKLDGGGTIRIDLVGVDDFGKIQFVELKRVQDSRLIQSEIVEQMSNYKSFLEEAGKNVIVDYYNDVLSIMKWIGICPKHILCDKISGVNDDVELMVTKYKKKGKTSGRLERLKEIKKICDENNIKSNIDEVLADYESI